MPIDIDRLFVFVHVPKTGGTSISHLFNVRTRQNLFFTSPNDTSDKIPAHLTWVELKAKLPEDFIRRAFKFAFVRNPWDRFLSAYLYARQTYLNEIQKNGLQHRDKMGFNECHLVSLDAFVQTLEFDREVRNSHSRGLKGHLETQSSYVSDESGRLAMDFIGRFENFDSDVRAVAARIGLTVSVVPHRNTTHRTQSYRDCYSVFARNAVASFYSEDVEQFGYTF
jgi:chondroitin 4-sulfotransferase 11